MFLKRVFTWWNGATFGALFTIAKRGRFVGEDAYGNRYYAATSIRDGDAGRQRRWVIYRGYADGSKVPAEWFGWLQNTFENPPTIEPLKVQRYETQHLPNLTGTRFAWKPKGSLARGGRRAAATGDYEAWRPE